LKWASCREVHIQNTDAAQKLLPLAEQEYNADHCEEALSHARSSLKIFQELHNCDDEPEVALQ
jgi:hypothetical protein